MLIEKNLPFLESILRQWQEDLGQDYTAYKNHLYRMINFCFALHEMDEEQRQKVMIAACFHDLGIWTAHTFDYLDPSIVLAETYLRENDLSSWKNEIRLMIAMHHKVFAFKNDKFPSVEVFRQADLVDVSLGAVKFGLPSDFIKRVKAEFPNAGFHKRLMQLTLKQLKQHPLKPLPMMRW